MIRARQQKITRELFAFRAKLPPVAFEDQNRSDIPPDGCTKSIEYCDFFPPRANHRVNGITRTPWCHRSASDAGLIGCRFWSMDEGAVGR
jgi:hypothetical protein